MHFPTIYSTVRATRGIKTPQETTSASGSFVALIKKLFGNLPWYEYAWYVAFVVAGILCLSFFKFSLVLLISVLSLYVYMVSSNLQARGIKSGLYFSIFSSGIYVGVCVVTHVWGEVISNCLIYIPLSIIALVKWSRLSSADSQNELKVTRFGLEQWWFTLCFIGVGAISLGLFLSKVLGQSYAFINSFSIFVSLAGDFARNNGKREAWLLYNISNLLFLLLWFFVSSSDGWETVPYVISSFAGLFNSIIGMVEWQRLYSKNKAISGTYLASKVRKKIKHIIRLRRQMRNMMWKKETDENWQNRYKSYKTVRPKHK